MTLVTDAAEPTGARAPAAEVATPRRPRGVSLLLISVPARLLLAAAASALLLATLFWALA